MNILILEPREIGELIPRADRRWQHVKKVLRKGPGDSIAAGLADGPLGEAVVRELDDSGMRLDFAALSDPPPLAPLRLVIGFPRPIQAARILKDLTSLGVAEIHLTGTELGEKSYASSSIFKDRDFRASLVEGAEQAGNPRLPLIFTHWSLRRCLEALASERGVGAPGDRLYLHPYGESEFMGSGRSLTAPVTLAVGSERGWTDGELAALEAAGFSPRSLGARILKTETAALVSAALALAELGLL